MKAGELKKGDGKEKERLSQKICATKPNNPFSQMPCLRKKLHHKQTFYHCDWHKPISIWQCFKKSPTCVLTPIAYHKRYNLLVRLKRALKSQKLFPFLPTKLYISSNSRTLSGHADAKLSVVFSLVSSHCILH